MVLKAKIWIQLYRSGDAAASWAVIHQMVCLIPNISFKILIRDENLKLMEQFLTDGARSIPKLIAIDDESMSVLGEWGPRPHQVAQLVNNQKANPEGLTPEFSENLQMWYNKDKGQSIAKELLSCLFLK